MIHKMYSIRDEKAEMYHTPFFSANHGLAMRTIQDLLKNPDHPISKYTADFSLWYIGEYSDETGLIAPENPKHLFNLVDIGE